MAWAFSNGILKRHIGRLPKQGRKLGKGTNDHTHTHTHKHVHNYFPHKSSTFLCPQHGVGVESRPVFPRFVAPPPRGGRRGGILGERVTLYIVISTHLQNSSGSPVCTLKRAVAARKPPQIGALAAAHNLGVVIKRGSVTLPGVTVPVDRRLPCAR